MKTIRIKAKKAISFFERLFGLINPKNPRTMFFQTRFGIHTFFLKNPLDILVLDDQNNVKVIKKNLKPFSFFFYPIKHQNVIELPAGSVKKMKIDLDDKIEIIP